VRSELFYVNEKIPVTPSGIEPATFRFVTQHLNHCASAVPNIKMFLQELRWGGLDWIDLARDRDRWRTVVKAVMNFLIASNARDFLTS